MEDFGQRMGIAVRKNICDIDTLKNRFHICDIDVLKIRFHKPFWVTADSWDRNVQSSCIVADAASKIMALPASGMHSLPNRDSIESYTVCPRSIWQVVHGGNG
jgi:hypothetical protein